MLFRLSFYDRNIVYVKASSYQECLEIYESLEIAKDSDGDICYPYNIEIIAINRFFDKVVENG